MLSKNNKENDKEFLKSFKDSEIKVWKQKVAIGKCYEKLFKKISPKEHETIILNPNNLYIQVNEDIIKPLITKNFQKLVKKENFLFSNDGSSQESSQDKLTEEAIEVVEKETREGKENEEEEVVEVEKRGDEEEMDRIKGKSESEEDQY
ncbi:hypothetical protein C1646_769629 [Rhizophagus diaphanus]|nr:hypothetical protein C1646_769629 [Rhizophagus diaphanus] [Rhizophagus sp. MUCL 43196]